MGKKKFIDKKKAATFRLVYKDSSDDVYADGSDRTFIRVDGSDVQVPGFDDFEDGNSIFDDAEEDDDEQEEDGDDGVGSLPPPRRSASLSVPGSVRARSADRSSVRSSSCLPEHVRQEILDLGFPDDGYNYLLHMREVGPSGRTGNFVPTNNLRLDLLRPDIKAYDASKVNVLPADSENENTTFNVAGSASQLRSLTPKVVDADVAALLDGKDNHSLVSGDELEDDFILIANKSDETSSSRDNGAEAHPVRHPAIESDSSYSDLEPDDNDGDHARPTRFLDEQFELLAMREYDDDDIGELDYDDPLARGPAHISKFNDVMSDFLINNCSYQDRYETPVAIDNKQLCNANITDKKQSSCEEELIKPSSLVDVSCCQYETDESEEKEVLLESESDDSEKGWDCETIVSTYSTLDNHPGKISAQNGPGKVKGLQKAEANKNVIRLGGKQQLPVDYLPVKSYLSKAEKKKPSEQKSMDSEGKKSHAARRKEGETKEEKKARKAAVKEEKRTARATKKELKLIYKGESQRAQHTAASTGPGSVHVL